MATELATAYVSLVPSTRGIQAAVAKEFGAPVSSAAAAGGKRAGSSFASTFKRTLGAVSVVGGAFAVAGLIKDAVSLEAAYSKTMRQVAVATNAPKAGLRDLDRLALKLGQSTVFSANEAADAMLQLAKGGLTPAQIRAGALANTLTLATAGGLELATAADSVVQTMGAFGLGAKETGAAVSALAGAANASSAEVSDITQALSQAGTEAHASGLSVQETTGILAAFADAGILGSDAGTSLRTMLTRLIPQTEKASGAMADVGLKFTKANGEFVSATQIAERLQKSLGDMSAAERSSALTAIFGADARRAANILVQEGADGLRKYIKQTSDLDQAQKLADASMSGTAGAMESLSGAVETAKLELGRGLAPVVIDVSNKITDLLEDAPIRKWTTQLVDGVGAVGQELKPLAVSLFDVGRDALPLVIEAGGTTVDVLEALLNIARPLVSAVSSLPDPVRNLALVMGGVAFASRRFSGGLSTAGAAVSNMVLDFRTAPNRMDTVRQRMVALGQAARSAAGAAGIGALLVASQETRPELRALEGAIGGALTGFAIAGGPGALIGGLAGGIAGLATAADDAKHALTGYEKAQQRAAAAAGDALATLDPLTGAYTRYTRQLVAEGIVSNKNTTVLRQAASLRDLVTLSLGNNKAALDRVVEGLKGTAVGTRLAGESTKEYNARLREFARDAVAHMREPFAGLRQRHTELGDLQRGLVDYAKALKGLPKQAITEIQQRNGKLSIDVIKDLREQYRLTPKDVTTVIKATNTDLTRREIIDVFREYDHLPESVVTFLKQEGGRQLVADVRAAARDVKGAIAGIKDEPVGINLTAGAARIAKVAAQLNMAHGGPVFGAGTGTSDSVPARLSRGEHVLTAQEVRMAGGHSVILAIRRMMRRGEFRRAGDVARFASGGPVEPVGIQSSARLTGLARAVAIAQHAIDVYGGSLSRFLSDKISKIFTALPSVGMLGPGGTLTMAQLVRGYQFARSQVGKPYVWGGVGPGGYDCSGFQSAILNASMGRYPYSRLGSTGTMPWSGSSPGVGRYTIGWFTGSPGHTSGNILGANVESSGGVGVRVGGGARSPLDGMFNGLMHYDTGGILRPGFTLAYNGTGRNEIVAAYAEGGEVGAPEGLSAKFVKNVLQRISERFGKNSPVVGAIERWLNGLNRAEFSQRRLQRQLREVARARTSPLLRQFRVGPRQARSETRSEVRELVSGLRQLLGKDSHVVKRVGKLGERLVNVQARQDKTVAKYQRANDKLDAITERQKQIVADVRAAFTHDAFGGDITTVDASSLQARADRNDAQRALRQFRQLAAKGLDAGIIKQIARSGNTALIADLAKLTPKQIAAYEQDIKSRNKATQALGEFVGNKALGEQVRAQRRLTNQLERSVNHWNRVIDRMEEKVERAAARGTERGVRAGMRDREHRQVRRRRAKAIR